MEFLTASALGNAFKTNITTSGSNNDNENCVLCELNDYYYCPVYV